MSTALANGFGQLEGDVCWRNGCQGVIAEHAVENCSCHISPPCGECTAPREYCPVCDWQSKDEGEHLNDFVEDKSKPLWEAWKPRPLDTRRIDWRSSSHTHSSMVKEGVYPEGTTREQVIALVEGTFGGRFESFGDGKFKYIAYTD